VKIGGSTVLLTGATGGIGHAIARALQARGAKLILTGRRTEVLEPLTAELGATAFACDLSEAAAIDSLLEQVGEVDILVANAALPASGRLETYTVDQIDRALDVNLRAPIVMAHTLTPGMVQRGRASKYGLRGFATALRADLHGSGVGVSAIFPGFIREAGMFADTQVSLPPGIGTRSPEDVAAAVVRAIEHDRAEIDVAPLPLRVGTMFAGVAPELSARVSRRLGSDQISQQMEASQLEKR
jgi:short-subunit dehydrogenase